MRPGSTEIKRFIRAWQALVNADVPVTATDEGDGYITLHWGNAPMVKVAETGAVYDLTKQGGTLPLMGNIQRMTTYYKKIVAARGK